MKYRVSFVSNSSSVSFLIYGAAVTMSGEEWDELDEKLEDLEVHPNSMDEICIGKSPTRMQEDQTLREFKNEIKEKLESYGIDTSTLDWQEDCYQDG